MTITGQSSLAKETSHVKERGPREDDRPAGGGRVPTTPIARLPDEKLLKDRREVPRRKGEGESPSPP